MVNVIAATSFFGTRTEGMWRAGDTKRVSAHRANELIEEGLAIESSDQSEPEKGKEAPDAAADKSAEPVTLDSLKEKKDKTKTKEEKASLETKDDK